MEPVGLSFQRPDMLKKMSELLSIKSQQQGLQGQAAQVQQEQLRAQHDQDAQSFFKEFDPTEVIGDDGTVSLDKALSSDKFKKSGLAKDTIMKSLLNIKHQQLSVKSELSKLDADTLTQLGTGLGALRNNPDVREDNAAGRELVTHFMTGFGAASPQNTRIAKLYGGIVEHAPPGKLADGLGIIQLQSQSASEQQAQQNPSPGMVSTGARDMLTTIDRSTGLQTPTGQVINRETPPGIMTAPNGQLVKVAGGGNQLSPLGSQENLNPTATQQQTSTGLARGITDRVTQAMTAANNTIQAQDALSRARAILESTDSPNPGAAFERKKNLKNLLSSLGIDSKGAEDDNSLVKNLARYEAARAAQAGLGGTDAARELAHNGSPNTQIDKGALKGIINQSLATEKALAAYSNKQSKTQDPQQMQQNEASFRSIPNLIEGYEYGLSRNKAEADEFLKKHGITPDEMKKTRSAIKEFEGG